jgi:hypothetical protein
MCLYPCFPTEVEEGTGDRTNSDSKPTETGMDRLALNDNDAKVRRWFVAELKKLGCNVIIDEMGNIFGIRPGKNVGPPTAIGSHLDTQPTGGRYDGILGVMAALEGLRTLVDSGYETEYPFAVIDWTKCVSLSPPSCLVFCPSSTSSLCTKLQPVQATRTDRYQ